MIPVYPAQEQVSIIDRDLKFIMKRERSDIAMRYRYREVESNSGLILTFLDLFFLVSLKKG